MPKSPKTPRPKARNPKGFRDYLGAEAQRRTEMLRIVADIFHLYGFDPLETPAVETVEALGSFLPDVDRPNEGVFAWQEPGEADGDWLALRYDMTAPLARFAAQFRSELPSPFRRYAMGPVWRNEKPGPGRFRQFYQCDADTVGTPSSAADTENCAMLCDVLEGIGVARGDYVVRLNDRRVLNGVMEAAGLLDPDDPAAREAERGIVLRAIDKLDRLGPDGVRALLGPGRRDDSGDFTKGAGLGDAQADTIMAFTEARRRDAAATLGGLRDLVGRSATGLAGIDALGEIAEGLGAQGYDETRVRLEPSVVRGLGYYTGPVYEAELTAEIRDEKGAVREFGSVASGGRYDGLVARFTGQEVPATGISLGVDRLLAARAAFHEVETGWDGPVIVTVMDRDRMPAYQAMAAELRKSNIRAEVYLGNPKNFGNQLKYADKRRAPVAIIQGEDEAGRNAVQIKDLALGARLAAQASHDEWKAQPAQTEVPRGALVAEVRRRLHGA